MNNSLNLFLLIINAQNPKKTKGIMFVYLDKKDNPKIKPVYFEAAEDIGFYNVFGNVAEMTSTEGVAMGGSWKVPNSTKAFAQSFSYEGASAAVGIRMIFEIIE